MKDPRRLLDLEWNQLNTGVNTAKHEYHSFILSTVRDGRPESRTMILRYVDKIKFIISFHTDCRSKKYTDLTKNNHVSALFYDGIRRIQLRISGTATIQQNNKITKKAWEKMEPESKLCYMGSFAPSEKLASFKPNLPEKSAYEINLDDEKLGYNRFCKVNIKIKELDWLCLHHKGHQRLIFNFGKKINSQWVAV